MPLGVATLMSRRGFPSALGVGAGVFRDRDLEHVAADEHGHRVSASRDHVGVVNAEVAPLEEDRRLFSSDGRLAVPAQERRTELQALRAEDPRIVVVAAEGNPDNQALGGHEVPELLEAIHGDLIFLGTVLAVDLGLVEGVLRGDELATEYRRFLQVRLLAVARPRWCETSRPR